MSSVREGDTGPEFTFGPVTREDIVRYAGATYDFIPLHHDEEYARAAGHPTVFAHGLFPAGLLGSFITRWFGPESVRAYRVRLREQVWPGDILRARGKVLRIWESGGQRRADLEVTLVRQNGEAVVTGSASVVLRD